MSKVVFMVLMLMVLVPQSGMSEPQKTGSGYDHAVTYAGPYKAERLYQLDARTEIWYPSSKFETWRGLACYQARRTLRRNGTWFGNLSDAGHCLGSNEAPHWATGHFLNFQFATFSGKTVE